MIKYEVIIYWSDEDEVFVAEVPEFQVYRQDRIMGRNADARAANTETRGLRQHWPRTFLRIIFRWQGELGSEGVQPRQQILVALPAGRLVRTSGHLFKSNSFGLQVGLGVMACRIQMSVSKHVPHYSDVDS